MENPLHWNLATNVIGFALQEYAEIPPDHVGPSLQWYIAKQLEERGLLTAQALEEVGLLEKMP